MYGHLRREENDAKMPLATSTSATTTSWQKPSPTSTLSDDGTKGENTQSCHDGGTGTNSNRYARKKSGLKPIRPTSVSASNLNPMTPGKLPQTPRLNFKENDHPRFGMQDFSTTPKFGRSESTPELHRIRKLDHLLYTAEKIAPQDKVHNNVLQENSMSNLLTLTSDSLPDIFRKPIIQQQPDAALSLQTKFVNPEDKVSKWGYGPTSSTTTQALIGGMKSNQSESHKDLSSKAHFEGHGMLKPVKEETPIKPMLSRGSVSHNNPFGVKNDIPLWNRPEMSSAPNCRLQFTQPETEEPVSAFSKSLDKSNATETETVLQIQKSVTGSSTQPTVKIQQHQQCQTPLAKKMPFTGQSSSITTSKPSELGNLPCSTEVPNNPILANNILPAKPSIEPPLNSDALSHKPLQIESIKPIINPPEAQQVKVKQADVELPNKPIMSAGPISAPTNVLPPTNSRPIPKTKQITVNGKLYTVMKPLGRGGSSVVYQVLNPEMTDIFALKVVRLDSVDEFTAEGYINEVRLLKQLQGLPRVVRLLEYEYNEEEEKLLLVMEKGDTDFASVIRNRTSFNAINPTLIRFYWQEMLEAVGEIHAKNVIHTDLKPANFLLVNGGLKLIDFGIATSIQADATSIMKDSQCGTYNYMAPEAIKSASPVGTNQEYKISRKTDVWSLGCMLYSLIYKNPPFNKFRDTIEKINAIVDERYLIEFPQTADPMAVSVLKGCLDRNPRNRPSIEQLLSHPYLTCANQLVNQPTANLSHILRIQLDPFIKGEKLTEEAKEVIRQWM